MKDKTQGGCNGPVKVQTQMKCCSMTLTELCINKIEFLGCFFVILLYTQASLKVNE